MSQVTKAQLIKENAELKARLEKVEKARIQPGPVKRQQEIVSVIPAHRHHIAYEDAVKTLKGKGTHPDQQAVISIIQWSREDITQQMCRPLMTEREAGYHSGAMAALLELERVLQRAHKSE